MIALLLATAAWAVPPVVVVQSDDLGPYTDPVPAFQAALGQPVVVVNLHGRESEAQALVRHLKDEPPRVVFALGAKAAWAVHEGLPNTPIVYTAVMEPDRYGLTGPEVSGIAMAAPPLGYLSQFASFFPEKKRIGVLRGPGMADAELAELQQAATDAGLELVVEPVGSPREVRSAVHDLATRIDALWLHPDRAVLSTDSFRTLTEETRRLRVPLLVSTDNMVRAGGAFAVVPDPEGIGTQAAAMVKAILEGGPAGEVVWPEDVQVALNVGALELAGVGFDPVLLDFVDLIVE
jgi:putative ABC transport system substrate-binding protein